MEEIKNTEETLETPEVKTYVVNCMGCGASLRVKEGAYAFMCPVCNKLFSIRKSEKLVKDITEEEKDMFLNVQNEEPEEWDESELVFEEKGDDEVVWEDFTEETTSATEEVIATEPAETETVSEEESVWTETTDESAETAETETTETIEEVWEEQDDAELEEVEEEPKKKSKKADKGNIGAIFSKIFKKKK